MICNVQITEELDWLELADELSKEFTFFSVLQIVKW